MKILSLRMLGLFAATMIVVDAGQSCQSTAPQLVLLPGTMKKQRRISL